MRSDPFDCGTPVTLGRLLKRHAREAEGVFGPGRRTVTLGIVLGISAVGFEALGV